MKIRVLAFALAFIGLASPALAQAPATVKLCVQNGTTCTPISVGNPLPTSGGGGGGGGAVTIVNGGDVAEGSTTDAPCASGSTTPCTVEQRLAHMENLVAGAIPAGTATIGNVNGAPNVTATDCSGTVTTGGTAQNAFTAQTTLHGFTIANVDASAGSGEPIWISFTGTATAANGSYPLAPPTATTFAGLSSFTSPVGFGLNHAVSVLGATTGHKFSCTWW